MNNSQSSGFTLIELMITISIIGILASLAIPAYMDYTAKAQTTKAFIPMDGLKLKSQLYFQIHGACISNNSIVSGDEADQNSIAEKTAYADAYLSQIRLGETTVSTDGGCTVTATFKNSGLNNALQGNSLVYELYGFNTSTPKWACYTPDIQEAHYLLLPNICRHSTFSDAKI